jgi:hypothetical protein
MNNSAEDQLAAEARTARRQLASFLMIMARHARDERDFALLADAVIPWSTFEHERIALYKKLLEAEADVPASAVMARAWERLRPAPADLTDMAWLGALEQALLAYGASGEQFSANTLLELVPAGREYLAGRVIRRLRGAGRLEVTGSEPSRIPSRKGAKISLYQLSLPG